MAALEQREVLFVKNGTRAVKYLVQFSIWNRGTKNLNSIYDSLVKYVRKKKLKKFLWKWCLLEKKFSFF